MDISSSDIIHFLWGLCKGMCKISHGCEVGCWAAEGTEVKHSIRNIWAQHSGQYLVVGIHIAPARRHWIQKNLILARQRKHFQLTLIWLSLMWPYIQLSELAVCSSMQFCLGSLYVKTRAEIKDPKSVPYSDSVGFVFWASLSWNLLTVPS